MRGLRKLWWFFFGIAFLAGPDSASQWTNAGPADQRNLQQLLTTYGDWGLPLPPPDARLVLFETGTKRLQGFGKSEKLYALAFQLKPATAKERPLLLVGTRECRLEYPSLEVKVVEPDLKLAQRSEPAYFYRPFEINAGLATAVQCKARGWDDLAAALLERSLRENAGHHFGCFCQPADQQLQTALAFIAWAHWGNELAETNSDRDKIYYRMENLLSAEPKLKTQQNKALLRRLRAALKPSAAKPASPEVLVDALVEVSDPRLMSYHEDPRYRELVRQGFDAMPALINHLADERLTRSVFLGFNNSPPRFYLVGDFASEIIRDFADEDLLTDRRRGLLDVWVSAKTASKWWERVRIEGERAYLLRTIFPKEHNGKYPRRNHADVLAAKYPRDLVQVYETILKDRPDTEGRSVIDALAESSLPREEKLELLRRGAAHKNKVIRGVAAYHLKQLSR